MTLKQITDKIKRDLDLEEESFITDDELIDIVNEAIKMCEAQVHGLYEDYFKTETNLPIVTGTSDYSMPSDMYADKIRKVIFNDSVDYYEIKPIKDLNVIPAIDNQDNYVYDIVNVKATGTTSSSKVMRLYPTSRETSSSNIKIYYIRTARELQANTDVCDIPEFQHFIIQYAKVECLKKEKDFNAVQVEQAKLDKMEKLMIDTLMNRKDDENNEILMDFSIYSEMGED